MGLVSDGYLRQVPVGWDDQFPGQLEGNHGGRRS